MRPAGRKSSRSNSLTDHVPDLVSSRCGERLRGHRDRPRGQWYEPSTRDGEPVREKKTLAGARLFRKAAGLGFEPRLLGPEPSVLPLDDPAKGSKSLAPRSRAGSSATAAS